MSILRAFVIVVLAASTGAACKKSDPSEYQPDKQFTDLLAGKPDAELLQLTSVLQTYLTPSELEHLVSVDWRTLTPGSFFRDPVLLKALALVENEGALGVVGKVATQSKEVPSGAACPDVSCNDCSSATQQGLEQVATTFMDRIRSWNALETVASCTITWIAVETVLGAVIAAELGAISTCVKGLKTVGKAVGEALRGTAAAAWCFDWTGSSSKPTFRSERYTITRTAWQCSEQCTFPPFTQSCGATCVIEGQPCGGCGPGLQAGAAWPMFRRCQDHQGRMDLTN
jgi:hypothetical protein